VTTATCPNPECGREFTPKRHQKFCSTTCRVAVHRAKIDSGLAATVASVRLLKSGATSIVLHLPPGTPNHLLPGVSVAVLEAEAT
jgi:hypothetical protein